MSEGKTMSHEESLSLIQNMISKAKEELEDKSFYYLLWGWLVFIASMTHFILLEINYEKDFLPWIILMPLGGIISALHGRKSEEHAKVKTYTGEIMKYVLIAFMVSLFTVLFFMSRLQLSTYPMVMLIYGIWLFISGGALNFRPIIVGGILNWIFAIVAFFFLFKFQLIILALAVLLGYIIPGYMLKNKYNKEKLKTAES